MSTEQLTLAEKLQRRSHRICSMILNTDLPWIDIAIEINAMRDVCETEAPEKLDLFEAVYVSRFNRLREQWRIHEPETELSFDFKPSFLQGDDWDEGGLASA